MVIPVLLGLLAWALVFGPLLLLWWLPRNAEATGVDEVRGGKAARSDDAPNKLGPMS